MSLHLCPTPYQIAEPPRPPPAPESPHSKSLPVRPSAKPCRIAQTALSPRVLARLASPVRCAPRLWCPSERLPSADNERLQPLPPLPSLRGAPFAYQGHLS